MAPVPGRCLPVRSPLALNWQAHTHPGIHAEVWARACCCAWVSRGEKGRLPSQLLVVVVECLVNSGHTIEQNPYEMPQGPDLKGSLGRPWELRARSGLGAQPLSAPLARGTLVLPALTCGRRLWALHASSLESSQPGTPECGAWEFLGLKRKWDCWVEEGKSCSGRAVKARFEPAATGQVSCWRWLRGAEVSPPCCCPQTPRHRPCLPAPYTGKREKKPTGKGRLAWPL